MARSDIALSDMALPSGAVRVRVPATSANLGPGFDALGLSLSLYDDVAAWPADSGLGIEISGEGESEDLASAGDEHLVVRAMRAAFAVTGGEPPGLRLRCVNRIPHGRGLGSSAAAIVAGLLAARALAPGGRDALPDDALLHLASGIEGHPDNVAACLRGGLTIAWTAEGQPHLVRLEPLPSITPVVCVAPAPVRTDEARRLLPGMVPHQDAAATAGRSALLVAALTRHAEPEVLFDATQDWLHQDYRSAAMPQTGALVRGLREKRIPAVVSGAGPSVLALLTRGPDYGRDLDTLGSIVRETGIAWHISSLEVERKGARILRQEP
jgi:homoserine kinase